MSRDRQSTARRCVLVVAGLVALVVVAGTAGAATEPVDLDPDTDLDGNGTETEPYNVTNASELQAIAGNLTAHYQLTGTINATNTTGWNGGNGFDPIGNRTHDFNGSLDGNGFGIENLTINRTSDDVGLFGYVGRNGDEGQLTNLTLRDVNVSGGTAVGALVGNSTNVFLRNVTLSGGRVNGSDLVGGLVGRLKDTDGGVGQIDVEDLEVDLDNVTGVRNVGGVIGSTAPLSGEIGIENVSATATVEGHSNVGGLIGQFDFRTIKNVTTAGTVTATSTGTANVGGIVGLGNRSTTTRISLSSSSANVSSPGGNVGGLAGSVISDISRTVATGNVSGGSRVGGLVGTYNVTSSSLQRSYASGAVEAAGSTGNHFGGLVGEGVGDVTGDTVLDVYATGPVEGNNNTGGLIGSAHFDGGEIKYAYAAGPVSGENNTGGLVGNASGTTSADSYWDEARTGQSSSALSEEGLRTYEMVGDEPKTEMPTFFSGSDEWERVNESNAANDSYPILIDLDREPQLLYPEFDRPTVVSGEVTDSAPDEIRLEFDGTVTLNETPNTEGFSAFISGSRTTIDTATATGKTVVLSLADTVSAGDSVSVSYADDNKENLLDTDGDEAASFTTGADGVPSIDNNVGSGGGGGSAGGGGGGDGDDDDDDEVDQTVDDDGDTDVTGGNSGDVIEINDETIRGGSVDGLDTIAVDGLSIELATDRDFWIDVETYELGEEEAVDAVAEEDGGTDTDEAGEDTADTTTTSITASFENETETVSVGYVTVTHNLAPEDIANVTFEFSVKQEYLDDLDVDPENVSLYRQTDRWTSLSTDYQELRLSRYRFEADSPGFSSFAIGTNAPLSIVINGTLNRTRIEAGENATAIASINNRGQNGVVHTVTLTADGETVATDTVAVEGGEIVTVPLSFAPTAGTYEIAVDDVPIGSLTVRDPGPSPWWLLVVGLGMILLAAWLRRRQDDETPTDRTEAETPTEG